MQRDGPAARLHVRPAPLGGDHGPSARSLHRPVPSPAEPSPAPPDPPGVTLAARRDGMCLVLHRAQHRRHLETRRYPLGLLRKEEPLPAARYLSCFCSSLSFLACGSPAAIFALGGLQRAPLTSASPGPPRQPRRHRHLGAGAVGRAAAPGA